MSALKITAEFSSAHFYRQDAWSAARNREEFGRCYSEYGHGHNYKLEVTFEMPTAPTPEQEEELRKQVRSVADLLDHHHLNFVVEEFKTKVPTTENIALWIAHRLPAQVSLVRLYEMPNLFAEVRP